MSIVTGKVKDDTPAGYHWKATLTPNDPIQAAKDFLVANGYVNFFVSSEEIRMVAAEDGKELSDEELSDVIEILSNNDLDTGISEDAVRGAIAGH